MALRHRVEKEGTQLKGVDLVDEETDLALGQFTLLQNFIPANVYAIKKKRGITPLNPTALQDLLTEDGEDLLTEGGDNLLTEI
jgi:hypothetical protein